MSRRVPLWLLLAGADDLQAPYVCATLGWLAEESGAVFEAYLESRRDGALFAGAGSTVLGGGHHEQFNYLCAAFDVTVFVLGRSEVFDSSVAALGLPVAGRAATAVALYRQALAHAGLAVPDTVLVGPRDPAVAPYLYPEVRYRRALGVTADALPDLPGLPDRGPGRVLTAYLSDEEAGQVAVLVPDAEPVETVADGADQGAVTVRIATRWRDRARGVGFGDPLAILAQIPRLMREDRVAVFAPATPLPPAEVVVSAYAEQTSRVAEAAADLALALGNPVLVGRQTGDGDLFAWSGKGVCMQITEPNRPAFPAVALAPQQWAPAAGFADSEPTDEQLRRWAREGVVLTSLVWHSGEIAHNEAVRNLVELVGFTGLKMGVGVHAERYATAPQVWELLAVARERGGVRGLVEPLLHAGGRGVLAEAVCPPVALAEHCRVALEEIASIAGSQHAPVGYYAFCDADLETLHPADDGVYAAIESAGLRYVVSSARPGRNRVLRCTTNSVVVNQSARSVAHASPFVRITTEEELREDVAPTRPGWVLATLDAPVIAFNPYIWRHGHRFLRIVDWITGPGEHGERRNVLPGTIARYARILYEEGYLPGRPAALIGQDRTPGGD
ncbi:hypothetical protein [Micromonospora globbae]|uniref:hypothetical protein n=1 Tax=Micromonospora globbae TaxID=1894969 RepID=UPI0034388417